MPFANYMPATREIDASPLTRRLLLTGGISVAYLLVSYGLIGFRAEQGVLVVLGNGLYHLSAATRRLVTGFSGFIVYWVLYDYMKAFPNHAYRPVNIAGLYGLEKDLFGITVNGVRLTPNEYWAAHGNAFLDVASGLFYLCWIPVPLAFAGFLFFRDRRPFVDFALTFLVVNLLGFAVYYLYPVAPPWYVQQGWLRVYAAHAGQYCRAGKIRRLLWDIPLRIPLCQGVQRVCRHAVAALGLPGCGVVLWLPQPGWLGEWLFGGRDRGHLVCRRLHKPPLRARRRGRGNLRRGGHFIVCRAAAAVPAADDVCQRPAGDGPLMIHCPPCLPWINLGQPPCGRSIHTPGLRARGGSGAPSNGGREASRKKNMDCKMSGRRRAYRESAYVAKRTPKISLTGVWRTDPDLSGAGGHLPGGVHHWLAENGADIGPQVVNGYYHASGAT
jgi:hypothetical protein